MILIADSGSTKTDWILLNDSGQKVEKIRSIGFNPYFQSADFIYITLLKAFEGIQHYFNSVDKVFFYGAGCSSNENNQIVEYALSRLFTSAEVTVNHDMMAAARATLGQNKGIACILGTGSNSAVWSGYEILENIPSYGYIFGDEGSGAYLGIALLKKYFSNTLSNELRISFQEFFNYTDAEIIQKVYKEENPNVFVASFASFYSIHADNEQLVDIIHTGFDLFFKTRVTRYDDFQKYPLGFVGSISFHLRDHLEAVATKFGCSVKEVIKCPIDNLVEYHLTKEIS